MEENFIFLRKGAILILLLTFLFSGLLLSGLPAEVRAEEGEVIRVGVVGPYTGDNPRLGLEMRYAVEMAMAEIDYQLGDYQVELLWVDSASDPEKAVRAYEDAILREEMDVGLLNWHSSVALALMEVSSRYEIPHFFGLGATELVNERYHSDPGANSETEANNYWMAKGWPVPEKLSVGYVLALESAIVEGSWEPENKRAAIFGENYDWGLSFGSALEELFREAGWEIEEKDYFDRHETDLYPLLSRIRDVEAEVVGGSITSSASLAAFLTQAREIGLESLIVLDGLDWIDDWYELTGETSDYILEQVPQWATAESLRFKDEFQQEYELTPGASTAGLAYDYAVFFTRMAQAALDKYGELNSETLYEFGRQELSTGNFTFTEGIMMEEYKYTADSVPDPIVGEGYFIFPVVQYIQGEGNFIWPDRLQEAELTVPENSEY